MIGAAGALTLFLILYVGLAPLIIPIVLLMVAVILRVYSHVRKVEVDPELTNTEVHDVIYYSLFALLALYVGDMMFEGLFQPPIPAAVSTLAVTMPVVISCYVSLMAISEEVLFRGEIFDTLLANSRHPLMGGGVIFFSAVIFTVFHIPAYGNNGDELAFVFLGGLTLGWSAWKTRRLTTPVLAHLFNNLFGSAILVPIILIIGIMVIFIYKRKLRRAVQW